MLDQHHSTNCSQPKEKCCSGAVSAAREYKASCRMSETSRGQGYPGSHAQLCHSRFFVLNQFWDCFNIKNPIKEIHKNTQVLLFGGTPQLINQVDINPGLTLKKSTNLDIAS